MLLTLMLCAIGSAWADEAVIYYAGTSGNSITVNNFTIAITGNTGKNWTNGNGIIKYNGKEYQTLKNSNGAQNTITCPDGKVATKIVFYVTTNADAAGKLSEIDGVSCDDAVKSLKDYSNPTTIEKTIESKHSFTFTFSTKQVCFIAVVTYEDAITDEPTLKVSGSDAITLALTPTVTSKSETFTLKGANLTDGTYNLTVPSVAGLTVTPTSFTVADGAFEQEFTVTYASTTDVEEASADITATVDDLTASVSVTYSARTTYQELTPIAAAATWDWTSWNETVDLGAEDATLDRNTQYVFDDIISAYSLSAPSSFNGATLAYKGRYPVRGKKSQDGTWTFVTTVPGNVSVTFSDTGSSLKDGETVDDYAKRYLNVNGVNAGVYSRRTGKSSDEKTGTVYVPAGEVSITGMQEDGKTYCALVVNKIVFEPVTDLPTVNVTISDAGYRTFTSKNPLDFTTAVEGLTAYTAAIDGDEVTFNEVTTAVPAGTGLLLKGAAGDYQINVASEAPAAVDNAFIGVTNETIVEGAGIYVLLNGEQGVGFYKTTAESFTVGANTAYLPAAATNGARSFISVRGEATTGISSLKANEESLQLFDLQGRSVVNPAKGLYIVNGKKVIIK